uniref:uncharacterized protein LOC106992466 n=1 Tax=Macaca mulatta TaxID=9544 RepID=UPI0010A242C1|nr:uncharacterized protein LOC106992466 [Macaca mulatta]
MSGEGQAPGKTGWRGPFKEAGGVARGGASGAGPGRGLREAAGRCGPRAPASGAVRHGLGQVGGGGGLGRPLGRAGSLGQAPHRRPHSQMRSTTWETGSTWIPSETQWSPTMEKAGAVVHLKQRNQEYGRSMKVDEEHDH